MKPVNELPIQTYQKNPLEQHNSRGEKAAIRFFDSNDRKDMQRLRQIIAGAGTQQWMDEVSDLSDEDLRAWAKEKGGWRKRNSYLFAVVPNADQPNAGEVMGFVYIYGGKDERAQADRLIRKSFLPPDASKARVYEISAASIPNEQGIQEGSGLMASARRQAVLEVDRLSREMDLKERLHRGLSGQELKEYEALESQRTTPDTYIFTFVDPDNMPSLRAAKAAGFIEVGETTYDPEDESNPNAKKDLVLILDWSKNQQRLAEKSYPTVFTSPHRQEQPVYVPIDPATQLEDSNAQKLDTFSK